jgi:hypothetical protein
MSRHQRNSNFAVSGVHSARPSAPLASAGPSDARTQPAWRSSAAQAGEDAAARSVPAAASGVLGRVEGTPKVKVTCTVKQGASASSSRLRWRLSRAGQTVRHGTTAGRRARLELGGLPSGRYLLHVQGQRSTVIVVE